MGDSINALLQANRSGSVLDAIAHPTVVNPLAAISSANQVATSAYDLQAKQAQLAAGRAFQASIDPDTGMPRQTVFNQNLAADPRAAMAALTSSIQGQTLDHNTFVTTLARLTGINNAALGLVAQHPEGSIPLDEIHREIDVQGPKLGMSPQQIAQGKAQFGPDGAANYATILRNSAINLNAQQALVAARAQTGTADTGAGIQGYQTPAQLGTGQAGAITPVGPQISKTASPDTVLGLPDVKIAATADDAKNHVGGATAAGQPIYISGAEAKRRQDSGLLPPNAILGTRPAPIGGVTNSDGTPVSPTNAPRLNVTPPAQSTTQPPQTVPPAPPGATTAAPTSTAAPNYNTGIGAVLAPTATTAAHPAAPVSAAPAPPPAPPVASTTAAPAPATTTAPPSPPDPFAAQKGQAKASGQEVPIPGGQGLVAKPDGNVGPPNRDSMMPRPRAALQGGVPVASANALLMPNVTSPAPPGAPNALVPGDVAAITAGMNRARATPTSGTQQAVGGSGSFAAGPGYDEQVNATTSQERLATDSKLAASYAGNVFPYTQALAGYGRGMTTAPGSDFLNAAKGFAGGVLRSVGVNTPLSDDAASYDAQHKWLSQIITGNPVAQGSDARLAATLAGNANTGIHELAGADMMKAGIGLMRMTAAARAEWDDPQVRAKYGYYNDFLRDFNKTVDPRAFAWDMYNPEQKKTLIDDLNAHRSDPTYAKKLQDSLALVRRNGYLGETRAMP